MKRILLIGLIFAIARLTAQPILTFPFSEGLLDQAPTFNIGGLLDEGPSGDNQIWDFSAAVFPQIRSTAFDLPENTLFASFYPDADLVVIFNQAPGTYYNYYNFELDGVYTAGLKVTGDLGVLQTYSNTRRDLSSPLQYEDSYTDIAEFHYNPAGPYGPSDGVSDFSLEVDGYGTLITPDATYNNVLRIHTVEITTLTFEDSGNVNVFVLETYGWVIDGYPFPLMTISNQSVNDVPGQTISKYLSGVPLLTSDYNTLKRVSLYPVPAIDFVNIDMGDNQIGTSTIRIYDIRGVVIKEFTQGMAQVTRFDVSDLPSGFYSINIQTEEGIATKHFTK